MTAPVHREILVNAAPQRTFDLFTGRIGAWWPLDTHAAFDDDPENTVAFEGDLLVERCGERECLWGEVIEWHPAAVLALTWHPGYEAENATDIRVTFEPRADQTLVTLTHTGWERMTDPAAAAAEYGRDWPGVLARFVELVDEVS